MTSTDRRDTLDRLDEARDAIIQSMAWNGAAERDDSAAAAMRALVAIYMARISVAGDVVVRDEGGGP